MKINCISCGHAINVDDAYGDFAGLVKCYVCGGLLEIKASDGRLQSVNFPGLVPGTNKTANRGSAMDQARP